jgi:hypothetical protein
MPNWTSLVGELLGGVVVIAGVVLVSQGDRILARVRPAGDLAGQKRSALSRAAASCGRRLSPRTGNVRLW